MSDCKVINIAKGDTSFEDILEAKKQGLKVTLTNFDPYIEPMKTPIYMEDLRKQCLDLVDEIEANIESSGRDGKIEEGDVGDDEQVKSKFFNNCIYKLGCDVWLWPEFNKNSSTVRQVKLDFEELREELTSLLDNSVRKEVSQSREMRKAYFSRWRDHISRYAVHKYMEYDYPNVLLSALKVLKTLVPNRVYFWNSIATTIKPDTFTIPPVGSVANS